MLNNVIKQSSCFNDSTVDIFANTGNFGMLLSYLRIFDTGRFRGHGLLDCWP